MGVKINSVASLTRKRHQSRINIFSQIGTSLVDNLEGPVEEEPPDRCENNSKWIYQPPKLYKIDDYFLPDFEIDEEKPGKFEKHAKTTLNERIRFMLRLMPETNAKTYLHQKFKSGLFTSEEKSPWDNYSKAA